MILYEYPFNERIRTYLRLEQLLQRLSELLIRETALDHHFALVTLFEMMDMASRVDIKTDLLRDLESHKSYLSSQRGNPAIDQTALEAYEGHVDRSFNRLKQQQGRPCGHLVEDDWLMGLRSRMVIPGGACSFNLPAYHAWQQGSASVRLADLNRWIAPLQPLTEALSLLLSMLRRSGAPQMVQATQGQFQCSLLQGRSVQLMRLHIPGGVSLIPEISGNRLMVSIRLLKKLPENKVIASNEDVAFELTLCS